MDFLKTACDLPYLFLLSHAQLAFWKEGKGSFLLFKSRIDPSELVNSLRERSAVRQSSVMAAPGREKPGAVLREVGNGFPSGNLWVCLQMSVSLSGDPSKMGGRPVPILEPVLVIGLVDVHWVRFGF